MAGDETHFELALPPGAVHGHEVDRCEPTERFAQRSRGDASAVPVPAYSIDHDDLHVAGETQMLEPVVAQNDVALGAPEQDACRGDAIRTGGDRNAGTARQQDRFVTDSIRIAVGPDFPRPPTRGTPVPAAHDPHTQPALRKKPRDCDDQRSLAGSPDAEIADNDHLTADSPRAAHAGPISAAAKHREQRNQPPDRSQQGAERTGRIPEVRRLTHGRRGLDECRRRTAAGREVRNPVRRTSMCRLPGAPRREGQPVETGLARGIHDRDDRLMRGLRVRADDHLR